MNAKRKAKISKELVVLKKSLEQLESILEEETQTTLNLGDSIKGDSHAANVDLLCSITESLENAIEDLEKI